VEIYVLAELLGGPNEGWLAWVKGSEILLTTMMHLTNKSTCYCQANHLNVRIRISLLSLAALCRPLPQDNRMCHRLGQSVYSAS